MDCSLDFSLIIVEFLKNLSNAIDQIIHIPYIGSIVCGIVHFFVASFSAYLFINLSGRISETKTILLSDRESKKVYRKIFIKYCMASGFLAAIIVHHQFRCFEIFYAALYGIVGPRVIIERIRKAFSFDPFEGSLNKGVSYLDEKDKQHHDTLKEMVEEELKKTGEEELRRRVENELLGLDEKKEIYYDILEKIVGEELRRILRERDESKK